MPGYIPPEGKLLQEFTANLHTYYKGTNPERKKDIAFIEKMSTRPDLALRACILKLKKTEFSYDTISSNIYGKFFKSGSELHNLLKNGINIDGMNAENKKNNLDDKQCLIYVNQLAKDMKRTDFISDPNDPKSAQTISDEIKSVTSSLLTRLAPVIENTLKRPPTQRALLESFSKIPEAYEKACSKDSFLSAWIGYKEKHEQYTKFIKIMHDLKLSTAQLVGNNDNIKWTPSYTIPYGILLHIRNQIAKEYKLRSAKNNSRLHDLCEEALNIQPGTVVPNEIQDVYFSDLRSLIARLKCNPQYIEKFEKAGLKKAKEFLTMMEKELGEELTALVDPEKNAEAKATTKLSNVVAWTAQFGFSIISGNMAARLFPGLSESVLKKTIGLVGLIYYGRKGENLFLQIGGELESRMLGAVAGVFCMALDPVGTMAGYLAGEALGIIISIGEKGIQYMTFNPNIFPKNLEDYVPEQEWLQTLYDVLPEDKRKILLKVTDGLKTEEQTSDVTLVNNENMIKSLLKMG
jgi:hypothetical protein